jgi:L-ascorbate metabolism protein UlaG (beta-lactamase superfamily)
MQREILPAPDKPDPRRWPDQGLHAAWLGHSTVLLKMDGFTIITDPVFSTHAGFHFGPLKLGVKRLVAPALELAEIPRVDLVILSHAHMDHFDLPSLRKLEGRGTPVLTAPHTTDLLRVDRYGWVRELAWGDSARVGPVEVRAVEVNHWGARYRTDTHRGYNGYIIEAGRHRVLFGGDTANTEKFRGLRTRRGFDVAIMPIGAYQPWIRYHCTPEQAWRMGNDAGVERFVPVHYGTFPLGREGRREPIERFLEAAGRESARVVVQGIGQTVQLS